MIFRLPSDCNYDFKKYNFVDRLSKTDAILFAAKPVRLIPTKVLCTSIQPIHTTLRFPSLKCVVKGDMAVKFAFLKSFIIHYYLEAEKVFKEGFISYIRGW